MKISSDESFRAVMRQLDERREALGMTRPQLAQRSGISIRRLRRLLTGERSWEHLPYTIVADLAKALGCEVVIG